jgi:hypothetical protein
MPHMIGQTNSVRAEQAGVGMMQNLRNCQLLGHGTSVLPCCAAEGDQYIFARIAAFGDRDGPDRFYHVGVGDSQ